jgi:hypothetical protein
MAEKKVRPAGFLSPEASEDCKSFLSAIKSYFRVVELDLRRDSSMTVEKAEWTLNDIKAVNERINLFEAYLNTH